MATQTPEVEIHEPDGVLQDPCHSNGLMMVPHPPLSSIYHGTWPIAKGKYISYYTFYFCILEKNILSSCVIFNISSLRVGFSKNSTDCFLYKFSLFIETFVHICYYYNISTIVSFGFHKMLPNLDNHQEILN